MLSGEVIRAALALLPVLFFLAALNALDSYKLVARPSIFMGLAAGATAAIVCFVINSFVFRCFPEAQDLYAHFGAPVVEELAKAAYWVFLIAAARVAFMVDSAICAFAVGTGFALIENITYLHLLESAVLGTWILRGFGTAIMHGGVAALGASISSGLSEGRKSQAGGSVALGISAAIMLHMAFNQATKYPVASALAAVAGLPPICILVFWLSERSLRRWLGGKLDRDSEMLEMIESGEFLQTPSGVYLQSLNNAFTPHVRADMLSYLHLNLELSAQAKGDLIRRGAGLPVLPNPDLESQVRELEYLEKSIGSTGMLAIRPLLSRTPRDLWEMHNLKRRRR